MLSFAHIIPAGICDSIPEDLPFLFFHQRDEQYGLLDRIARHIENLDSIIIAKLELSLNLQFTRTTRDSHGNVCFAGDPNLRPEYRTIFHAIDLWDYYYALWHSPVYWESEKGRKGFLPFPSREHFWNRTRLGNYFRTLHSSKVPKSKYEFDLNFDGVIPIEEVSERFQTDEDPANSGQMYLNENNSIGHVPRRVWEFNLAGRFFLSDYLGKHVGQNIGHVQIEMLLDWIVVIDRTCKVQIGVF